MTPGSDTPQAWFPGFAGDGSISVDSRRSPSRRSASIPSPPPSHCFLANGRSQVAGGARGGRTATGLRLRPSRAWARAWMSSRSRSSRSAIGRRARRVLSVYEPELGLVELTADALRDALDDAGIRWRVIVVRTGFPSARSSTVIRSMRTSATVSLIVFLNEEIFNAFGCSEGRHDRPGRGALAATSCPSD